MQVSSVSREVVCSVKNEIVIFDQIHDVAGIYKGMICIYSNVRVDCFHGLSRRLYLQFADICSCVDNLSLKIGKIYLICIRDPDACVMAEKPFSHAGIIRFQGQLMTYVPGQGPCYRCAFQSPPPKDAVPTCKQAGVIGAMGGVIGSLQAMEAIKYIIGQGDLLTGRLLTYDALKMTFRTVKLPKNHHCPVCGDDPTITELIDYEQAVCELKH